MSTMSDLLGSFLSGTRLYRLKAGPAFIGLHVEAWSLQEALNEPWRMSLVCVGERVSLDLSISTVTVTSKWP